MNQSELERYSRSIILPQIGIEGQLAFKNASIFVLGCGGVASGLLPLLASNGVGRIGICDFDTLELSNLQRQHIYTTKNIGKTKVLQSAKLLRAINGNINVKTYNAPLNAASEGKYKKIIQNYDIVIDTSDTFASRNLINKLCVELQKPLFGGAAIGFDVQVYMFKNAGESGCYNCIYENPQDTKTCANSGVFAPAPSICGSLVCSFVLQYILQGVNFKFFNTFYTLNLQAQKQNIINIERDEACKTCSKPLL